MAQNLLSEFQAAFATEVPDTLARKCFSACNLKLIQ